MSTLALHLFLAVTISYSKYRSVHPVTAQEENPNPYDLIDDVIEGVSLSYLSFGPIWHKLKSVMCCLYSGRE